MEFGIFYEHQLPRPWGESSEYELLKNSLAQIELAGPIVQKWILQCKATKSPIGPAVILREYGIAKLENIPVPAA